MYDCASGYVPPSNRTSGLFVLHTESKQKQHAPLERQSVIRERGNTQFVVAPNNPHKNKMEQRRMKQENRSTHMQLRRFFNKADQTARKQINTLA
jgi:hypothetical protein